MDQYLPVDCTEVVDFPKFPATLQSTWYMYTHILANFFFRKFLFLSILFLEFYTVLVFCFGTCTWKEISVPSTHVQAVILFCGSKAATFLQFICLVFRGDRPNKKSLIAFCIKTTSFFIWHIWPYACCDLLNYSWVISATLYSNSDDHRLLHRAIHYYSLTYM